jgi:hypothetical protein
MQDVVGELLRDAQEELFDLCREFPNDKVGQAYQLGIISGLERVESYLRMHFSPWD